MSERPYLSIGEVLGLLLEEFPDVTISKIRFLESQGLIDPERTASGYRKFYDGDVDRLRVILREQRENFLPLRVIRDRLESGEIDDSGGITAPRGIRNVSLFEVSGDGDSTDELDPPRSPTGAVVAERSHVRVAAGGERSFGTTVMSSFDPGFDETGELVIPEGTPVPTGHHPAAQSRSPQVPAAPPPSAPVRAVDASSGSASGNGDAAAFFAGGGDVPPSVIHEPSDTFTANELCIHAGITNKQLAELESYGLVSKRGTGITSAFTKSDLAVARACKGLLDRGVDARHLKGWRHSAEREAALFEQLVVPLIRQRNPHSHQQAVDTLNELSRLGSELRQVMVSVALQHHLEG